MSADAGAPVGVILAGGLARRMGGADKALLRLGGRPLLALAIARLRPQTSALVLNANGDPARFAAGFATVPVIADPIAGHLGPLAGLLAGLRWTARHRPHARDIVSLPVDTPFAPTDLVARLQAAREAAGTPIACAASHGRIHHAVGLWPVHLADDLAATLAAATEPRQRRLRDWAARHGVALADYADAVPDPFANINTPAEHAAAEADQTGAHTKSR